MWMFNFIFFLSATWNLVSGEVSCNPLNAMTAKCDALHKTPLKIRSGTDFKWLREVLANVRDIRAGVIIEDLDVEMLDVLRGVDIIANDNGPALIFRRNKNLKRVIIGAVNLTAPEHTVEFEDDNFVLAAYENEDSLDDLLHMEHASRAGKHQGGSKCSTSFMKIKTNEDDSWWFLLPVLIITTVLFLVINLSLVGFIYWQWRGSKKLDKQIADAEKPKKAEEEEQKEPEAPNEPEKDEEPEEPVNE